MEDQGPQTQLFLGDIGQVGAVDSPAHPDDTVEFLAGTLRFNRHNHSIQFLLTPFIHMPIWEDLLVESIAVVTDTFFIEDDLGVRGVHDAVCTNYLIF